MVNDVDILLIEDNPMDVRLVVEALKQGSWNCNISVAGDGEEGLQFLKKEAKYENSPSPDLILLDLKLPKVSGTEVLAEIKKDDNLKRIPVIVLTSSDSEKDIKEIYDLSASVYITKPFNMPDYFKMVKTIEDLWFNQAKLPEKDNK